MDHITTQQAAEKWSVSMRWVQMCLKADRIPGAILWGRIGMIPKDAVKPLDTCGDWHRKGGGSDGEK